MQEAFKDPESGVVVPTDPLKAVRVYEDILKSLGFAGASEYKECALEAHGLVPGFPERMKSAEYSELIRNR